MKKTVIGVVLGTGVLLTGSFVNSNIASANTNHYVSNSQNKAVSPDGLVKPQNAFAAGVLAGVVSAAAYDAAKASGAYLASQYNKATSRGAYKAAPKSSYASAGGRVTAKAITIDQIPVKNIKEFGR
ncbi:MULTISPECIES: hypothetical protein [unclassified Exiguobacterium]|uniref:hypothetical protein n=1 Tax=unclassified Exiguobacterium TaxID=2644629 RepID=UPI001BE5F10A|nr:MULTISPECIES: hypothetical protein [unclassified Exiguobacterium]